MACYAKGIKTCRTYGYGLVQRFQFHDRRAVIVADPERNWRGRVVDEYSADVGEAGQQILDELTGSWIQALHCVSEFSAGPCFAVFVRCHIVWPRAGCGWHPFFELLGLCVQHPY